MRKQLDYVSLAVGIVLLLVQIPLLNVRIDWYNHSATATGVVIRLRDGAHKPNIEFTTRNGERLVFLGSTTFSTFEVNDNVTVRYDVRQPKTAKIDGVLNLWFGFMFFTAMAFLALWKAIFEGKSLEANRDN